MTARMRGNMTGNAGELALFLKNWLTPVISRYPPVQELGKRISSVSYTHLDVYKRQTVDREKLSGYKKCGINRLSIGLQSTKNRELQFLDSSQL